MTSQNIILFSFDSFKIRIIHDENGDPLFVAKDVADALEYKDSVNAIKQHCKGVAKYHLLKTAGGMQKVRVIHEPDLYRLIVGSNLPSAERFEQWVFEEVLPSIRKTGGYHIEQDIQSNSPQVSRELAAKIFIAEAAARMLRMSDTSKIRMLTKIAESENISPDFLPDYVDEPLVRAITPLLKEIGHPLGSQVAKKVNPALEAMGILQHLSRKGRNNEIKWFWNLTDEGLQYGRNETSPNNPRETQPLFFVERFPELLKRLEAYIDSNALPGTKSK
ncbi:BRO-N domain-containing protein [Chromatium okenii]|uniref:Rha family transcriptional regulator n=1 Tax=Chromatium okenii TaxID=61644 RepID=A0A2S7XML7_9GAMM|nr:Bro-N domain-containing protein [Chromatium okenii]MBV5309100.1 Bro-N domain-containing protein [Chromatium okenii]PQJ94823.1 Rha family transcriptional regulator [Chromatium okenii]